ncbi:MAG: hypothetical protein Q4E52_07230 [Fibrobacter sp.]|nr:hypothetical protein [Fibrobacter sp.]
MDLNTPQNRQCLISVFPKLGSDAKFFINSPCDTTYNCIAFAMGFQDRWVASNENSVMRVENIRRSNGRIAHRWWPEGATNDMAPASLVEAFEKLSFEKCDNGCQEPGYEKVALYSSNGKWTHAAKVIDENLYHSKFGECFDAVHSGGDILVSSDTTKSYGTIFQFMKRLISEKDQLLKKHALPTGSSKANPDILAIYIARKRNGIG